VVQGAVNLIPEAPVASVVELAQHAERLGFQRCWVYDEGLAARDVYVALTAIAAATNTIQLGPGITNPYTRHATSTIGAIAALDELSRGRAFLGVGAGGSMTLDPIGLGRPKPLTAVRELIEASRALFSAQIANYEGEFVQINGAALSYARPSTEIWLAGRGPRMLALGAARCDGIMMDVIYKPNLSHSIDRVRRLGRESGNSPKISYSTMLVTDSRSMTIAKNHMTYRLIDSPSDVKDAVGLSDHDVDRLRSKMLEGLEAAGELVRDEWVLPFVISGSVRECANELADVVERDNIDEFLVPVLDHQNASEAIVTARDILQL
jgi:5,10-methylenetetrahydromethanopterin reductase